MGNLIATTNHGNNDLASQIIYIVDKQENDREKNQCGKDKEILLSL